MRLANAGLVARLQERVKAGAFGDSAYVLVDTVTGTDEYNAPIVTTEQVPVSCSFTDKVSREAWQTFADVETVDAEIRFDDVTPLKGWRVRIAGRFDGLTMTNKDYEIVGIKNRDAFGYVCALTAVSL